MRVFVLKRNPSNMADTIKRKLRFTTIVYWVLLLYIITALLWWAFSLQKQNITLYDLRKEHLNFTIHDRQSPAYQAQLKYIEDARKRNLAKYLSEGGLFLILILIGAVYIYRTVRQQFRVQQQQQNFVMAITHELKTPISVSRLNLETIQRYKLDQHKTSNLIEKTLEEILRLDTLIDNILISSQLEGHSYQVTMQELNLSDLVKDVMHQFKARYHSRIVIEEIEEDIDLTGDPVLLKLLVSNLIENAHKYSPREYPITVALKNDNFHIQLKVKDNGPGIDEGEKKNIFRKFYRIGNEQTRKAKGTGLGLHLSKKISEDHGGAISVEDNQPQGSTFIVTFTIK
jgi:two-component system, OmpR family, sensor histidine kinase CiaH